MPPGPERRPGGAEGGEKSSCESSSHPINPAARRAWPVRLSVRTPGFQPGKRGSTPLRAAIPPKFGLFRRAVLAFALSWIGMAERRHEPMTRCRVFGEHAGPREPADALRPTGCRRLHRHHPVPLPMIAHVAARHLLVNLRPKRRGARSGTRPEPRSADPALGAGRPNARRARSRAARSAAAARRTGVSDGAWQHRARRSKNRHARR